eukprot:1093412-Prymnesium_polylepis.1
MERAAALHKPDCTAYFLADASRILGADYAPSDADIVRLRVRTTGVSRLHVETPQRLLEVFDMGGLRSERRKWCAPPPPAGTRARRPPRRRAANDRCQPARRVVTRGGRGR